MDTSPEALVCHQKTVLIRPQHLNHAGTLFGGYMMQWADDMAYSAASLAYRHGSFVTKLFGQFDFKSPVRLGDIIKIYSQVVSRGTTSFKVRVWAVSTGTEQEVFQTFAVLVNVKDSKKVPIPAEVCPDIFEAKPRSETQSPVA